LYSFVAHAQKNGLKLFYGNKEKNIIGYKNAQGKIVIPAKYILYSEGEINWNECQYLYLIDTTKHATLNTDFLKVFNSKGKLLYNAYWFDNGADYFQEGIRRYVENGKIGFVNILGLKEINAQWDDATNFYNGLAKVGRNCVVEKMDEEHSFLSCKEYFLINREGKIITKVTDGLNVDSIAKNYYEKTSGMPLDAQVVEGKLQKLKDLQEKISQEEIKKDALFFQIKDLSQKPCWLFIFRTNDELYESEFKFLYYPDSKNLYQLNECGNKIKIKI
jgi:hypothetical protein